MKKITLLLISCFLISSLTYAGIPISDKNAEPSKKQVVKKSEQLSKKQKVRSFFERQVLKRRIKKYKDEGASSKGTPIFTALSMTLGVISFASLIAAAFAASIALVYVAFGIGIAAIVLGILGLAKKEGLRGLGIAGVILGGISFGISLLVALIDNSI